MVTAGDFEGIKNLTKQAVDTMLGFEVRHVGVNLASADEADELATGRRQKSDVIAYQIRQSFKPGEITAEEANKVGYELAMRFTKGKYAFIVATHTDREYIHNHIIYNSTALDSTRKFRDFLLSGLAVQRFRLLCAYQSSTYSPNSRTNSDS